MKTKYTHFELEMAKIFQNSECFQVKIKLMLFDWMKYGNNGSYIMSFGTELVYIYVVSEIWCVSVPRL